jgi:hypothetical protein
MTKDQWFLVCIIGALVIVAFAVGVPFLLTHKRMRSPDDPANRSEAEAYFRNKRVFVRRLGRLQRRRDTTSAQPQKAASKQGVSESPPGGGPDEPA